MLGYLHYRDHGTGVGHNLRGTIYQHDLPCEVCPQQFLL